MAKQIHAGIEFTGRPEAGDTHKVWDVKSAPIRPHQAIILSHQMWGTYVHFASTRTRPCHGSSCEHCAKSVPRRWEGFLALTDGKTTARVLRRITFGMSEAVHEYWSQVRTLRGHAIKTWRKNGEKNGPVGVELWKPSIEGLALPDAPNIFQIMLRVWGLKEAQLPLSSTADFRILKPTGTEDALPD